MCDKAVELLCTTVVGLDPVKFAPRAAPGDSEQKFSGETEQHCRLSSERTGEPSAFPATYACSALHNYTLQPAAPDTSQSSSVLLLSLRFQEGFELFLTASEKYCFDEEVMLRDRGGASCCYTEAAENFKSMLQMLSSTKQHHGFQSTTEKIGGSSSRIGLLLRRAPGRAALVPDEAILPCKRSQLESALADTLSATKEGVSCEWLKGPERRATAGP